ncbi:hypothetical protein FSW04_13630 [Baekduia soli]|uniref:Uncharacterized protein n=1 Tax=Baekduia soli TaxID=496014 RepID=A0A5B8U5Z1_9ACTN|nr:hypothetical protein [Baekduia soli]QEC48503.1 hypothetical protein FSW04_13630 [Baekduia soli]
MPDTTRTICIVDGCQAPLGHRTQVPLSVVTGADVPEGAEDEWAVLVWCIADEHHRMRVDPDGTLHPA